MPLVRAAMHSASPRSAPLFADIVLAVAVLLCSQCSPLGALSEFSRRIPGPLVDHNTQAGLGEELRRKKEVAGPPPSLKLHRRSYKGFNPFLEQWVKDHWGVSHGVGRVSGTLSIWSGLAFLQ